MISILLKSCPVDISLQNMILDGILDHSKFQDLSLDKDSNVEYLFQSLACLFSSTFGNCLPSQSMKLVTFETPITNSNAIFFESFAAGRFRCYGELFFHHIDFIIPSNIKMPSANERFNLMKKSILSYFNSAINYIQVIGDNFSPLIHSMVILRIISSYFCDGDLKELQSSLYHISQRLIQVPLDATRRFALSSHSSFFHQLWNEADSHEISCDLLARLLLDYLNFLSSIYSNVENDSPLVVNFVLHVILHFAKSIFRKNDDFELSLRNTCLEKVKQLICFLQDFMIEGSDTSILSLKCIYFLLCENPIQRVTDDLISFSEDLQEDQVCNEDDFIAHLHRIVECFSSIVIISNHLELAVDGVLERYLRMLRERW